MYAAVSSGEATVAWTLLQILESVPGNDKNLPPCLQITVADALFGKTLKKNVTKSSPRTIFVILVERITLVEFGGRQLIAGRKRVLQSSAVLLSTGDIRLCNECTQSKRLAVGRFDRRHITWPRNADCGSLEVLQGRNALVGAHNIVVCVVYKRVI